MKKLGMAVLASLVISLAIVAPVIAFASQGTNMMNASPNNGCANGANGHATMHGNNWEEHEKQMHGENWQNSMNGNMTQHHQGTNNSCH